MFCENCLYNDKSSELGAYVLYGSTLVIIVWFTYSLVSNKKAFLIIIVIIILPINILLKKRTKEKEKK